MKVYTKVLLWCFGTLLLSLIAFGGVSYVSMRSVDHGSFVPRWNALLMEQAIDAYEAHGKSALAAELARMSSHIPGQHFLTDARGTDLASGEDHSKLLAAARLDNGPPKRFERRHMIYYPSGDGKYRFLVVFDTAFDPWQYLPYYLMILLAIALLCWILATNIASPLGGLARVVDRFGAGDLSVRVNSTRKDEIGEVGRAFDRMAERIATLLTAERRLLQDISHELRSPLARLSFAAELARTAENRGAAIDRLNKEIARLTDLVGGLIQVTRVEGDPEAHNTEDLRLDGLLTEVVDDCRMEAEARGFKIALDAEPQLTLRGDREVLRRAIENVIRNSIRYNPSGRSIEVNLAATTDAARIAVRDYGPGVPEEVLPKIFQPFFRVDDSRDTATGGVGLGLAIASRAIGLHHGRLWAENVAPGLKVWIEIPLVG
uniref:histidine kinase n=1 Tax=Solibacter usitatus (strain Ellin6076) TaxID=234267 RepID=Q020N7_SOLUE